jgi:hypothetical protein
VRSALARAALRLAPLIGADVLGGEAGGLRDALVARVGGLRVADPLEDRAAGGRREGVPVAARASGVASSAARRSPGSTSSCAASIADQAPFAFAVSIAATPAGIMSPAAASRSTRSLFERDQALFALRGVISRRELSSSTVRRTLSIQPKRRASSTPGPRRRRTALHRSSSCR